MPTLPTIIAGADYEATATITKDGATYNLTGHTVTCSIVPRDHPQSVLIASHAVTLTTPASGIVTLSLSDTETDALRTDPDPNTAVGHVADFKVAESGGAVVYSEKFTVPVQRAITS